MMDMPRKFMTSVGSLHDWPGCPGCPGTLYLGYFSGFKKRVKNILVYTYLDILDNLDTKKLLNFEKVIP